MPYYAQTHENGLVHTVMEAAGIIEADNVVGIDKYDTTLLNKVYIGGQFVEPVIFATLDVNGVVMQRTFHSPLETPADNEIIIDASVTSGMLRIDDKFVIANYYAEVEGENCPVNGIAVLVEAKPKGEPVKSPYMDNHLAVTFEEYMLVMFSDVPIQVKDGVVIVPDKYKVVE